MPTSASWLVPKDTTCPIGIHGSYIDTSTLPKHRNSINGSYIDIDLKSNTSGISEFQSECDNSKENKITSSNVTETNSLKKKKSKHSGRKRNNKRRSTIVNITTPDIIQINQTDSTDGKCTARIELYVSDLIPVKDENNIEKDEALDKNGIKLHNKSFKDKKRVENTGDKINESIFDFSRNENGSPPKRPPRVYATDTLTIKLNKVNSLKSSLAENLKNSKDCNLNPEKLLEEIIQSKRKCPNQPPDLLPRNLDNSNLNEFADDDDNFLSKLKTWFYEFCWINKDDDNSTISQCSSSSCSSDSSDSNNFECYLRPSLVYQSLTQCFSSSFNNIKKLTKDREWSCSCWNLNSKNDANFYKTEYIPNNLKFPNIKSNLKMSKIMPSKLCKIDLKRNIGASNTNPIPIIIGGKRDHMINQRYFFENDLKRSHHWIVNLNKWLTDATFR